MTFLKTKIIYNAKKSAEDLIELDDTFQMQSASIKYKEMKKTPHKETSLFSHVA